MTEQDAQPLPTQQSASPKRLKTLQTKALSILERKPCLLYTICSVAALAFMALVLAWNNTSLVWYWDGMGQWYVNFSMLKDTIIDLVSNGNFDFWSWDVGLGQDTIGYLSTFLFNPFAWICVFFDENNMDVCFTLVLFIELYFAGLAACVYLHHLKLDSWICTLGALAYIFSATVSGALNEFIFIFPVVVFPLIILGIDLVYERKTPLVLVLSGGVVALNYLYMTYMIVVISLLYVIVKTIFFALEAGAKRAFQRLASLIAYVLLAAIIVSPLLAPSLCALLSNSKESNYTFQLLPTVPDWFTFIPTLFSAQNAVENSIWASIGVLGTLALLAPFVFARIKKRCVHSTVFAIALVAAFIPVCRSIMNAGSYTTARWYFLLVFFCVTATCLTLQNENLVAASKRKIAYIFASAAVTLEFISTVFIGSTTAEEMLYMLVNVVIGIFCFHLLASKKKALAVLGTSLAGLAVLMLLYWSPAGLYRLDAFLTYGEPQEKCEESSYSSSSTLADDEFYRSSDPNADEEVDFNYGTYYNIPTVEAFTSYLDKSLLAFNRSLSVNMSATHRANYGGNDERPGLDYLLGVKKTYLPARKDTASSSLHAKSLAKAGSYFLATKNPNILESKYEPSLGYVFNKSISESQYESLNEVQKEQALLQAAVVSDDEKTASASASELTYKSKKSAVTILNSAGVKITSGKYETNDTTNGQLTVNFQNCYDEYDIYLRLVNFHKTDYSVEKEYKIQSNEKAEGFQLAKTLLVERTRSETRENFNLTATYGDCSKTIRELNIEQSLPPLGDYVVYLGDYNGLTNDISLHFSSDGKYTWDDIEVIQVPKGALNKSMQAMQSQSLRISKFENDHITGTVSSKEDGILFLSIVKNPGWKIYIDGVETETFRADTAFTGCSIGKGKHQVELVYKPAYFDELLIVAAFGIVILVLVLLFRRTLAPHKATGAAPSPSRSMPPSKTRGKHARSSARGAYHGNTRYSGNRSIENARAISSKKARERRKQAGQHSRHSKFDSRTK